MSEKNIKKKRFTVPHTYVLLFIIIIIAAILTYIVPAGAFEKVEDPNTGRMVIDVDSFEYKESTPVSFFDVFKGVHTGMKNASAIIFFIFILGGAFEIIQRTGVIDAGINKVLGSFSKQKNLLIVIIVFIFSIFGGTIGMAEEVIIFIPITMALFHKLGYDKIVGAGTVILGSRIGFTAGLMNPFTVGVAQGIAELPLFSGLGYRIIWYVALLIVSLWYMLRYAKKIEGDPTASVLYGHKDYELHGAEDDNTGELLEFTKTHMFVSLVVVVGFGIMLFGILKYGWYMTEIAGIFLAIGIIAGLVGRLSLNTIAERFVAGAKELTYGALVVGVAASVLVMLEKGQIVDTIIHSAGSGLNKLPKVLAANGMYAFQLLLNVLIPSGSGQAATTMPIMAPLADMLGITRQTAVLAFHYGDGFTNMVSPTNGTMMASLAVAGISFERWIKWMGPLFIVWVGIGVASITIATLIGLGPF